jgi:hypothetical protein
MLRHAPELPRRSGRQLCHRTAMQIAVSGKVAARGRAARPTKRGRICEARQVIVASLRIQVRRIPVVPFLIGKFHTLGEDYRTASLFDSPESLCRFLLELYEARRSLR